MRRPRPDLTGQNAVDRTGALLGGGVGSPNVDCATRGDVGAHGTAIGLRVLALKALYPAAIITANIVQARRGADLICWTGKDGEVWVWAFRLGGGAIHNPGYPSATARDPRAAGRRVVPGPPLLPAQQSGVNAMDYREIITVANSAKPGVQVYSIRRYPRSVAGPHRQETDAAMEAGSAANDEATAYLAHLTHTVAGTPDPESTTPRRS